MKTATIKIFNRIRNSSRSPSGFKDCFDDNGYENVDEGVSAGPLSTTLTVKNSNNSTTVTTPSILTAHDTKKETENECTEPPKVTPSLPIQGKSSRKFQRRRLRSDRKSKDYTEPMQGEPKKLRLKIKRDSSISKFMANLMSKR